VATNSRINLVSFSGEDIKLTTFHQKLCYACLKSGGTVSPTKKWGVGLRVAPYSPHFTPMPIGRGSTCPSKGKKMISMLFFMLTSYNADVW